MTIQLAQKEDAAEILVLQKACYMQEAEIYQDYEIPPLIQTLAEIEADFQKQFFLKIVENGQIIGSVRGQKIEETVKIGRLIVHKDFQNRGLGKQLMSAIENHFSNAKRFELFTGHLSIKNLRLYQKIGYRECKRMPVNQRLTLVFFEK